MKYYEIRVTLSDLKKRIYRKIRINENMTINKFCQIIITSMNGDLSHLYQLYCKDNIYMIDSDEVELYENNTVYMNNMELSILKLQKGDKFKLNYDFGDDWYFHITVSKVLDDDKFDKDFEVIDGKGLGIIEDCGGIGTLVEYAKGNLDDEGSELAEYIEMCDLDEFDLEECNYTIEGMLDTIE